MYNTHKFNLSEKSCIELNIFLLEMKSTEFNGSSNISLKLRLREAETGASRGGFGTTTHAWIEFVVYD